MERVDNLMHTGLRIIQDDQYFSFGIDSILLAQFSQVTDGDRIIELGTGIGAIPLMLCSRDKEITVKALEIQTAVADLARRSVELNNLSAVIEVITGDLKHSSAIFGFEVCDVVICNPPYLPLDQGELSKKDAYAIARHEVYCRLDDIVSACKAIVRYSGKVNIVYKASRMPELLTILKDHSLEPKRLQLVQSRLGKEPHIFLVEAVKGARPGLKLLPTLIMYDGNNYTEQMKLVCFPEGR